MSTLPDDDFEAADYVLGTMDAAQRDAFVARVSREPELARMIDAWRMRLAPMTDEIVPVVPPMHLWHRVRARAGLAVDATPTATRWFDRLAFWRGLSFAGLAATVACVIALVALHRATDVVPPTHMQSSLPHPVRLVTTMSDGKGRNTYMAALDDDACTLVIMPLVNDPTPGEVPQVWYVAADGTPHSIGVGGDAPMQAFAVPDALRPQLLREGQTIAITMEPPGGSPEPTGFRIGKGELTHL